MANPPPDYYDRFLQELEGVRVNTEQMANAFRPSVFAQLSRKLGDVLKPTARTQYSGEPSTPTSQTSENTPGSSPWSTLGTPLEAQMREVLQAQTRTGRPTDRNEAEIDGGQSIPQGRAWWDRTSPGGLGQVLPLPRYPGAEPNAADLLNYMSTASANMAYKRQVKMNQTGFAKQQQVLQEALQDPLLANQINLDANMNPVGDLPPEVQRAYDAAAPGQSRFGDLSNFFHSAESGYAQGRYIKGIMSKVMRPLSGASTLGYETGAGGGSQTILGLRGPWDPGWLAGVSQWSNRKAFSLSNDVTPGQADTIYRNLYAQGWLGGPQTNAMRSAAAQITHFNPVLGSQQQTYSMMDEATRQGASSLTHFVTVMEQVPDAMKSAHVGMTQMLSDMDAMGQLNKQTGGTYIQGAQNAIQWAGVTGLPANIMQQLMQNPMVQAQTFMRTGLMPWEQGLASGGQHMNAIFGAVNTLSGMVNTPGALKSQIGNTGFYNTVSGQDQKEALMSHFMGVDKATIHTILTNGKGWQAGNQVWDESNAYAKMVRNAARNGQDPNKILSGSGQGHWGRLRTDLSVAVDSQGHKMFTKAQLDELQRMDHSAQGTPGHWANQTISSGKYNTKQVRKWIPGTKGASPDEIAQKRAQRIQKIISDDQGKQKQSTGPRLMIELGPAAKKVFHLNDPTAQAKAGNNAGAAQVPLNSAYAAGPTASPFPDLNTAGSGTYDYGSQYDTGNW